MFTEEQIMIQDAARSFARSFLRPSAAKREANARIEPEVLSALADAGFLGMTVPTDYGGVGSDYVSYALALIEIAAGDGAISTVVSVHNAPFLTILNRFGSSIQKNAWLKPAALGKYIGCFALTEAGAGSDAAAIKTRAKRVGAGYKINGTKQFITSASIGKASIVFAVTDPEAGKRGISAFYVGHETPGFSITSVERKLGQRASDTCSIAFENVQVSAGNLIGEEGQGYSIALSSLETGRIGIASQAIGMAQAALDIANQFAGDRTSFGKPIRDHQAVAFRLADMDTKIEAARQLVLCAARRKDAGLPCLREAAMGKLFASEMAEAVVSAAIQTLGGYGYLEDFGLEKIYRDVRVCQIYEGTSDIQRLLIARELFAGAPR